jgi:hypothetical protein
MMLDTKGRKLPGAFVAAANQLEHQGGRIRAAQS